jgi:hypothetical protein
MRSKYDETSMVVAAKVIKYVLVMFSLKSKVATTAATGKVSYAPPADSPNHFKTVTTPYLPGQIYVSINSVRYPQNQ